MRAGTVKAPICSLPHDAEVLTHSASVKVKNHEANLLASDHIFITADSVLQLKHAVIGL